MWSISSPTRIPASPLPAASASRVAWQQGLRPARCWRRWSGWRVHGPCSALSAADGTRAAIIGFSEQWTAPAPGRPFRSGGAARPAPLASALSQALSDAIQRLLPRLPLVGLNSVDFLVCDEDVHLIEINP